MIETQYNAKVRVLRSDNGGEYQSSDLQKYLEGHASFIRLLVPIHPNKMESERKNRHLLEVVRASLIEQKYISYWGEAITSAAYLINRTLDYDYHISKEDESGQSELVNQEAGELDMSGTTLEPSSNDHPKAEEVIKRRDSTIEPSEQFGSEDAFIEIPNQSSSAEGVLNLEPDPFMKRYHTVIIEEALADPRWKAAMNEEMKSLEE
ncbi:hypothetical protein CK203_095275 [Vitis vinifera]|uniref:Integrase catalytic domain-containing protein n=1 Tax=Vitis vinifera TaxID=29760 RepID=A0A438BRB1_VITVI|nr:hypothetical protein CK203_095275 [Vitis vinifera]